MSISKTDFFNKLPAFSSEKDIETRYQASRELKPGPVIVLDDDPTGIQTVHGIPVYMSWGVDVMHQIFQDKETAFIHTNTRAYPPEKVQKIVQDIMGNAVAASNHFNLDFEIISRSDSTLRGHFPLETEVIKDEYERRIGKPVDGEIIVPFFKEGGRLTAGDVHYVLDGDVCVPASETEFARDPDFGYQHADLKHYVEEKTGGRFKHQDVISISLEMLRKQDTTQIKNRLMTADNFSKIVLNAVDYLDVKAFIPPLLESIHEGKKFLFRSAASFVKTFAFIEDKPLLEGKDFKNITSGHAQLLLIAGSYTGKTTSQLDSLFSYHPVEKVELNVNHVLDGSSENEISSVVRKIDELISTGKSPVLYTSRTLVKTKDHLKTAEIISNALISIVQSLTQRPDVMVAKGGITSSVIAVEGLKIKKAMVEGQILPGVPVIISGDESKWPGLPYVIFPGNVGNADSLTELFRKF